MGWQVIQGRSGVRSHVGTMEVLQSVVRDDDRQV